MKVFTIPLPPIMTNCYIAYEREGGKCFIIDPASNEEKIKAIIEMQKLSPKAILLTHGHFDHISAADKLRDMYSIPLYIHENDAEMIKSPVLNCSQSFMGIAVALNSADKLLSEGNKLLLEKESLTVIHTPGHSSGSCIYVGNNVLFSGDTVFQGSYGRYDLPGGDYSALMQSIQRVMKLNPTLTVYPGHGEKTTIADEMLNY